MATVRLAHAPADSDITVVLADDHREVRRKLRLLLAGQDGIAVVAEAGDLLSAIRHVKGHAPRVLLLDLWMAGRSSIEVIRQMRARVPDTAIVVATRDDSPVFAQEAIEAGAIGYVLKENADGELSHAIRCASHGEQYVSPCVAVRLEALRRAVDIDGLSQRETEVLRLIALGLTSSEISDKLHLSKRTIDAHRRRIHRKLGLRKRSELVRYAIRHNLIDGGEPTD